MTKNEFIRRLKRKLSHLPMEEGDERINFYSEMIDDRMDAGLSEEDAVRAVGSVDAIAAQIADELKSDKALNDKIENKSVKAWQILLIILGSPIWLSLIVAAFAIFVSLFASIWAIVVSLWAVFGALIGSGIGVTVAGICLAASAKGFASAALICAGLVCLGLSILFFFLCKAITKGTVILTKNIFKNIFTKKEEK